MSEENTFFFFCIRGIHLKLASFVSYFKIIDTFLGIKKFYVSQSKLSKKPKNGIEILVGQAMFKLWIKTVKILLWPITGKMVDLLKF